MSLFHRRTPEPQPKDEPTGLEEQFAEINRLQLAADRSSSRSTRLILEDRMHTLIRELLHEAGVIPVIDEKTGRWKLFR